MNRTILAIMFLTYSAAASAQAKNDLFRYNGFGYGYFSAGASVYGYPNIGAGGGGEGFLWRGLTIGGDIGYFAFPADGNSGYGIGTINVGYHFVDRTKPKKIDPYLDFSVVGLAFRPPYSYAGARHVGGGVNYWFKERMGLQSGVQVQLVGDEAIVAFRVGLTFR